MPVIYADKDKLPERHENDFYETPVEFIETALEYLPHFDIDPMLILDPGAGRGVWGEVAREFWPKSHVHGIEIDPDFEPHPAYDHWINADFVTLLDDLQYNFLRYDLIIGNPPYKYAEEFVRNGYNMLNNYGIMLYLLPSTFLWGQRRAAGLWAEYPPKDIIISGKRIPFTGNSNPNLSMLCMWQNSGYQSRPPRVLWMETF